MRKVTTSYQQEFLLFGFQPENVDSDKLECRDCRLAMINDCMEKSKLLAHQQPEHPGSVGKERNYFEKRMEIKQEECTKTIRISYK